MGKKSFLGWFLDTLVFNLGTNCLESCITDKEKKKKKNIIVNARVSWLYALPASLWLRCLNLSKSGYINTTWVRAATLIGMVSQIVCMRDVTNNISFFGYGKEYINGKFIKLKFQSIKSVINRSWIKEVIDKKENCEEKQDNN